MQYKSIFKNILLTHKYDYIVKPIINNYNHTYLSNIMKLYPNNFTNVEKWSDENIYINNYFPHDNSIIINKEYNAFRGGLVFNLKYRPLCIYEEDYMLLNNVSIDNIVEYINTDLTKINKYYKPTPGYNSEDPYKYWFKVAIS